MIPVATRNAVVKLDAKKAEAKIRRWQAIAESAAKQSKRSYIPQVGPVMSLKEAFSYIEEQKFDLRMIPMKQAVVEVCEIFEVNPYRLFSENCVILACDRGGQMVRSLSAQGIPAAVIGSAEKGIARVIRHGEETDGNLERPRADELSRIDGNTI